MASTRISDVIVPEIFAGYVTQEGVNQNKLVQSGAVVSSQELSSFLSGGGQTYQKPSFKSTENDNDNVDSSDETSNATPKKLGTGKEVVIRINRNNSWSSADLTAVFAGADPLSAAASMAAQNRMTNRQKALLSMLDGVFATALLSSHVIDDNLNALGSDQIIDAGSLLGDMQMQNGLLIMHSVPYNGLQKANLITFEATNTQDIGWGTYLGHTVLVDDTMPVGATPTTYTTYLLGSGSIEEGSASARVPVEVEREAKGGDGGGIETLWVRDSYCYHVKGMAYTGTPAGDGVTNAELAVGASYTQVFDDKLVRVTKIITAS